MQRPSKRTRNAADAPPIMPWRVDAVSMVLGGVVWGVVWGVLRGVLWGVLRGRYEAVPVALRVAGGAG